MKKLAGVAGAKEHFTPHRKKKDYMMTDTWSVPGGQCSRSVGS